MDGPELPAATSKLDSRGAVEFLHDEILLQKEPVVLVTLAPLTNIALLLEQYPDVKAKIARICMMGGSLNGGNILPRSEFNIYHDPEAAKIVFNSGVPITMSGLGGLRRRQRRLCSRILRRCNTAAVFRGWHTS